ncbi:CO/xanthine dehydrogenase FAD-binding subunit [Amycolatopsis sulphurea]|uniref:CO/xanthine dehydrogenase FAD-binding subunit n=1 Tax=Amycolatopsis sulphurea TaxID=76022 RepID=A0A2A9FJW2_9PSEU|nr:FAD binding domain-containing protein [Amycolatopsis sulphurea]PFG50739.1 CO/xanthine dehydrogenase FAD-binding subunit [Amycolatopsis sulphurea]
MIRTSLRYHRPATPEETSAILAGHAGDVVVLGGGTMLLPMMNRAEVNAGHIVDLRGLGLDTITEHGDQVRIGARVTYDNLFSSDVVARTVPLLRRMASGITGGGQLRNLATAGGSACYGNPSSDVPAVLVALEATMCLHGSAGQRRVPAGEFFVDAFRTALGDGEFLMSMEVTRRAARVGYHKLKLCEGSWPIVTAAVVRDGERVMATVGAASPTPRRFDLTSYLDSGKDTVDEFVRGHIENPWTDVLADGAYRKDVSGAVVRRAVAELQEAERS